eukprot:352616-Chlamydomonas_euryale.AAC.12
MSHPQARAPPRGSRLSIFGWPARTSLAVPPERFHPKCHPNPPSEGHVGEIRRPREKICKNAVIRRLTAEPASVQRFCHAPRKAPDSC